MEYDVLHGQVLPDGEHGVRMQLLVVHIPSQPVQDDMLYQFTSAGGQGYRSEIFQTEGFARFQYGSNIGVFPLLQNATLCQQLFMYSVRAVIDFPLRLQSALLVMPSTPGGRGGT